MNKTKESTHSKVLKAVQDHIDNDVTDESTTQTEVKKWMISTFYLKC